MRSLRLLSALLLLLAAACSTNPSGHRTGGACQGDGTSCHNDRGGQGMGGGGMGGGGMGGGGMGGGGMGGGGMGM